MSHRDVFGRVEVEIKKMEDCITRLELILSCTYSPQTENELLSRKQEHLQWVHREEVMTCQKSQIKWLAEGDANTSFFHASMRFKRKSKKLEKMGLDEGSTLDSGETVHEGAVLFLQQLLSVSPIERNLDELELT